jgi:hypothetical protein
MPEWGFSLQEIETVPCAAPSPGGEIASPALRRNLWRATLRLKMPRIGAD